jgi:hypothetical protein
MYQQVYHKTTSVWVCVWSLYSGTPESEIGHPSTMAKTFIPQWWPLEGSHYIQSGEWANHPRKCV